MYFQPLKHMGVKYEALALIPIIPDTIQLFLLSIANASKF